MADSFPTAGALELVREDLGGATAVSSAMSSPRPYPSALPIGGILALLAYACAGTSSTSGAPTTPAAAPPAPAAWIAFELQAFESAFREALASMDRAAALATIASTREWLDEHRDRVDAEAADAARAHLDAFESVLERHGVALALLSLQTPPVPTFDAVTVRELVVAVRDHEVRERLLAMVTTPTRLIPVWESIAAVDPAFAIVLGRRLAESSDGRSGESVGVVAECVALEAERGERGACHAHFPGIAIGHASPHCLGEAIADVTLVPSDGGARVSREGIARIERRGAGSWLDIGIPETPVPALDVFVGDRRVGTAQPLFPFGLTTELPLETLCREIVRRPLPELPGAARALLDASR